MNAEEFLKQFFTDRDLEDNPIIGYNKVNSFVPIIDDVWDKLPNEIIGDVLTEYAEAYHKEKVGEPTLEVKDIRNKLSPMVTLIEIIENEDSIEGLTDILHICVKESKKSINYLSQREVFKPQ